MWKQIKSGQYTNGSETLRVQQDGYESFVLWKNGKYEADFDSLSDLHRHLASIGAERLMTPDIITDYDTWFSFKGNEHYEQAFSSKAKDGTIRTVLINRLKQSYSVYLRLHQYQGVEDLLRDTLDFVEEFDRNPLNDLEADVAEAMKHGASGMDVTHRNLPTMEDVRALLKDTYDIL